MSGLPDGSVGRRRSVGRRIVRPAKACATACTRFCALAWPGAAIGLIVAALLLPTYAGFYAGTGLGRPYWERSRFRSPSEPVLQTYEIPLSDFVDASPSFSLVLLKQIHLRFDHTRSAVIILDQVGFVLSHDQNVASA
jgi:hypothetical protein